MEKKIEKGEFISQVEAFARISLAGKRQGTYYGRSKRSRLERTY